MRRRFWKLWYRIIKRLRYREYYLNLPGTRDTWRYVNKRWISPLGDLVSHVEPGLISRPMPMSSHVTSKYARRVVRMSEQRQSDVAPGPPLPEKTRDWLLG